MAYCQIALNDTIQMNAFQLEAAKNLEGSRMGIYEHVGMEGPHILLRELITTANSSAIARPGIVARKGSCGTFGSSHRWSRSLRFIGWP